jgi:hypothetical protein
MTSPGCRAATPVQVRDYVRTFLLDLTDDHSGPASADGCLSARTRLEARLRDAMLAEELPGLVDVAGLALWADTLRLGLSSLVNDGMTPADAVAVIDIAIRCLDQSNCSPASSRHSERATMLRSVQARALSSIWRTHTVLGGEYAR